MFGGVEIPRQGTLRTSTRLGHMRIIKSRLCLLVAGAALVAGQAFAQAANPAAPVDATPGVAPTAPAEDLSKKLNQSNGVIHPKEVIPYESNPTTLTASRLREMLCPDNQPDARKNI